MYQVDLFLATQNFGCGNKFLRSREITKYEEAFACRRDVSLAKEINVRN